MDTESGEGILELIGLTGSDDRSGKSGSRQYPRQRDLCILDAARLRNLSQPIYYREIRIAVVQAVGVGVGFGSRCFTLLFILVRFAIAGQKAAR